ncbi:MAG: hypothetical protein ACTHLT_03480 [Devosia sp.]
MRRTAKFVHDENIKRFEERLKTESDPGEIKRLKSLIEEEEEIYEAALRNRESGEGESR